tara:strand:+ start:564 stop:1016 length:453 start_codon:yes stop_codon:yes gene_type:complete
MDLAELTGNFRDEFISLSFTVWAYVALSVAVIGIIIFIKKWKKHEEKDLAAEFALALSISWFFDGLVRVWYSLFTFLRATDQESKILAWMETSYIPGFLALGVVVGGALHIHTLLKAIKDRSNLWRKWLIGLGSVTSLVILAYAYFQAFF